MQGDVTLVIENAMPYNKPGTPYYKAAQRIQSNSAMVLEKLSNLRTLAPPGLLAHNETMANGFVQPSVSSLLWTYLTFLFPRTLLTNSVFFFAPTHFNFCWHVNVTDPATTPTAAITSSSPELEVDSEAEQVFGKRKRTKPAPLHPCTDAEVLTDINPKASRYSTRDGY